MTDTDRTGAGRPRTIVAKNPADLLAVVPQVLGFHPEESLVLVSLGAGTRNFHARLDLPRDAEVAEEVAAGLAETARKHGVRRVVVIAYSEDDALARRIVGTVEATLGRAGVTVAESLRADGRRWFGLGDCNGPCCPADGRPYDVSSHPLTAQAVLEGRVTLGSRDELRDSLVGADPASVRAVELAADDALDDFERAATTDLASPGPDPVRAHLVREGRWVRQRVRRFLEDRHPLDSRDAGRLLVALISIDVRDVAWAEMNRFTARAHVELWRDLVRRCPQGLGAPPAALLGFAAWLSGDGALAWCAVDRCLADDPGYRMAHLLTQALAGAVHPATWQPLDHADLTLFAG